MFAKGIFFPREPVKFALMREREEDKKKNKSLRKRKRDRRNMEIKKESINCLREKVCLSVNLPFPLAS